MLRKEVAGLGKPFGRMAGDMEPSWPSKHDTYVIAVRDLAKAHRLAAESPVDHKATHGDNRYLMHGGGRSALRFGTEVAAINHEQFPSFVLGKPRTVAGDGKMPAQPSTLNDCK